MALYQIFLLLELAWVIGASVDAPLALPGCEDHCGNIRIPYPFGTREGCYIAPQFLVTCNHSYDPPKLYLTSSEINVTNIYLSGQLRILSFVAHDCYNEKGLPESWNHPWTRFAKFPVSNTLNKFIAIGCDTYAVIKGSVGQKYTTGCLSLCGRIDDVINGSCSGIGCCETTIPKGVRSFNISVDSYDNHTSIWDFNPCSYAFIVEEASYNFSSTDFKRLQYIPEVPVVLDWAIGNETCNEAKTKSTSYACKDHSDCHDFDNGPGYQCHCSKGYDGNPYLENGCRDIDECRISNPCNMTCHNLPGGYYCSCPEGYGGDGRINGTGCSPITVPDKKFPLTIIGLGISISLLSLIVGGSWVYWIVKKRKLVKLREKFFQQNGGLMFQQQLINHESSHETARIFTIEDLKKATNNYDENRVIGHGGYGTVYKGVLPDNRVVAIKKSKISDQSQIEQFINEVVILSQINHRNIVKLLGCCLETEVPLLVYEFITNGTLSDHIHDEGHATLLSWEMRLKIAAEAAGAIAYLHSAASFPIIHRDIKSTNILLDTNYTTKVSDFGASKLVPIDHTQLTTLVQGTFGYLDPEYFHSSQLTEKSDVYSFGVLLAELLTGEKALSFNRPEKDRNLAAYFESSMKRECLLQILDHRPVNEGKFEQLKEVAKLARRCLRVKGKERPTMKEVAMELEGLRVMEKHQWEHGDLYPQETEHLLGETIPNSVSIDDGCSSTVGYDSIIRNEILMPLDDGR